MAKKNKITTPGINDVLTVRFVMILKKPINPSKDTAVFNALFKSFVKLERDYIPDIETELYHFGVLFDEFRCSGAIHITKKFAKDHLYFNRKFSPEKYLGFYLSRVARNLRKTDKYFATKFSSGGMFTYEFFY